MAAGAGAARARWRPSSSSSACRPRTSRRRTSSSGPGWRTSIRTSCRASSKPAPRSGSCSCAARSTSSPHATLLLRPLVDPMIFRATEGNWSVGDVDRAALAAAGRQLVEAQPRTFAQLGALLAERFPDADPRSLAQQIRASSGSCRSCRAVSGDRCGRAHVDGAVAGGRRGAGAVAARHGPPLPRRLQAGQRAGHAEVVGPLAPAPGLRGCPWRVGVLL